MSATAYSRWPNAQRFGSPSRWASARFHGPRIISGVCENLAERAGLPVWMPRAAFLVFGVLHWVLAVILYVVLAKTLCRSARQDFGSGVQGQFASSPFRPGEASAGLGGVRDRFGALDARLADLESATLQQEAALRRQFRDLERG